MMVDPLFKSVLEGMDGSRNPSLAVDEFLAGIGIDMDDGSFSKKPSEDDHLSLLLSIGWDEPCGRRLVVDHAKSHFIGDDAGDRLFADISWNGNHVKADGADACHGFQLFQRHGMAFDSFNHLMIFADRDEGTGKSAYAGACHDATLLDLVVEKSQGTGGTRSAGHLKTHLFQDFTDGITDGWRGSQGQVDDAKGYAKSLACFVCYQLTGTGDLEGDLLHFFAEGSKVLAMDLPQCLFDDTRSADSDIEHTIALTDAMEGSGHERIVVRGVAEDDKFCTAYGVFFLCQIGQFLDDLSGQPNGIHVDAGFAAGYVDACTDSLGLAQGKGDAFYQQLFFWRHHLVDDGREASDEVDTDVLADLVQGLGKKKVIFLRLAAGCTDKGYRSDADALVDDWDTKFGRYLFAGLHQVFGLFMNLVIDVLADLVYVAVDAIQKRDAHGDGSHIELLFLDHPVGFVYFVIVDHGLNTVHAVEDFFFLHLNLDPDFFAELFQLLLHVEEVWLRL